MVSCDFRHEYLQVQEWCSKMQAVAGPWKRWSEKCERSTKYLEIFDHIAGEQSADSSATCISYPSLASEDVDLGLSGLFHSGVSDSSTKLDIELLGPKIWFSAERCPLVTSTTVTDVDSESNFVIGSIGQNFDFKRDLAAWPQKWQILFTIFW